MQDCLKFVAALLRKCGEWQPPVEELRALVGGAYADITTASASLLGLLRAVLDRKLVEVIEVYDVMKRVQVSKGFVRVHNHLVHIRICGPSSCIGCLKSVDFRAVHGSVEPPECTHYGVVEKWSAGWFCRSS